MPDNLILGAVTIAPFAGAAIAEIIDARTGRNWLGSAVVIVATIAFGAVAAGYRPW